MSTPRDYYIDITSDGVKLPGQTRRWEGVHVIEKAAADKLAEALEEINERSWHGKMLINGMGLVADKALKEYRAQLPQTHSIDLTTQTKSGGGGTE